MALIHLGLFSYQWEEQGEQNTIFRKCTVLRAFHGYQVGQILDAIVVEVHLHIWEGEQYIDEVDVLL